MIIFDGNTREEWLNARKQGLGGSDAGAVIGVNKYKTNVDVYREKAGLTVPEDISDKPAVKYGKEAEKHIRELFKLDYPEYMVDYHEFRMYANDKCPFIFATLDGELTKKCGEKGILEIKTTTIQNAKQWEEWDGRVPDSYYAQVCHQLLATMHDDFSFAVLRAYIRYEKHGELRTTVRDYRIELSEATDDIIELKSKELEFWECVKNKKEPALILPEI